MVIDSIERRWAKAGHIGEAVHRAKVLGHQIKRKASDLGRIRTWPRVMDGLNSCEVAEVSAPLWFEVPPEEWLLEAGKVANVRVAAQKLHGLEVPAGETFSFWAQIGRPSAAKGFVVGREVRAGCVIPAIAGGLCLLSNALYEAALKAGFEIIERHGHSHEVFQSDAPRADATVFWNYVDLRFRSSKAWRLEVELDENSLRLGLFQNSSRPQSKRPSFPVSENVPISGVRSCFSCDVEECRNHQIPETTNGRRAFLLDSQWPEFDAWLQENLRPDDLVMLPIDGKKRGLSRYAWTVDGVEVVEFPLAFAARSTTARIFRRQGPEMRAVQMCMDQSLALSMGRMLPVTVQELVVSQHLLVHLQDQGALGGRSLTVLANRPSLLRIQQSLNTARARWPHRSSLSDFRVDERYLGAEQKALARAREVITPNESIAADYGERATRIEWVHSDVALPFPRHHGNRPLIYFPGSTVARLGVCALREAIEGLDVDLYVEGRNLEEDGFWGEVRVSDHSKMEQADLVVFPAWLPHNPRPLLRAVELGIPVVASRPLGLGGVPGVIEVPCGDPEALRKAIVQELEILSDRARRSIQA